MDKLALSTLLCHDLFLGKSDYSADHWTMIDLKIKKRGGGGCHRGPPPPEVGLGETMAELAVPRGNSARRALFLLRPLGAS